MSLKIDFLINEALSLSPADRAIIAHRLISSIEEPVEKDVEIEWAKLAEKRLAKLENKEVSPISWSEIKKRVRNA